jgi:hypothetical protein
VISVACTVVAVLVLGRCAQLPQTGRPKTADAGPGNEGQSVLVQQEESALQSLAQAFNDFHQDTDGWPLGRTVWSASNFQNCSTLLPGLSFNTNDTAMFQLPLNFAQCDSTHTGGASSPCWNGPYLSINGASDTDVSLGQAPWLDAWGRPRMYAYVRPLDGNGGSITAAPNGLVFIWSRGPDGLDGFTCSDGPKDNCPSGYDINNFVKGLCSEAACDDIIVAVAMSSK